MTHKSRQVKDKTRHGLKKKEKMGQVKEKTKKRKTRYHRSDSIYCARTFVAEGRRRRAELTGGTSQLHG